MALLETLTDTFDTGPLDAAKWDNNSGGGGSATVSGGVLNLASGASGLADIRSKDTYTLGPASQLGVKVVYPVSGSHIVRLYVKCSTGTGESQIAIYANSLYFYNATGGQVGSTLGYDPVAHAWLRMRFGITGTSVTTYFDTSPDGITWTQRAAGGPQTWNSSNCYAQLRFESGVSKTTVIDYVNAPPRLIESVVDDFDGAALDTGKWTPDHVGGGSQTVGGGLLTLTLNTDPATDRAGIVSVANNLQLFGSSVYAKINSSLQANVNTEFIVRQTGGNGFVRLRYYLGYNLYYAYAGIDGSVTTSNIFSYDAPTMKYWRIRGAGNTIYFDTSANGTAWTQQASVISNWGSYCRVEFNINGGTGTRSATIDSVNVAAAPLPSTPNGISEVETLGAPALASYGPSISTLVDDFTGTTLDTALWATDHTGGTDAVGGGLLTLGLEGSASKAGVLSVISNFRLTGSAVFVKINPAVTGSAWTEFAVRQGAGYARVRYYALNAFIYCDITSANGTGITSPSMSYDANVWRFWRIRADNSGGMFIDSSPNATTWTQQAAASGLTWGDNCRVSINVNSGSGSRSAIVDAVNIVPAPPPSVPNSIADTETLGAPAAGVHLDAAADSIADPQTLGAPSLSVAAVINPGAITDPETLGGPETAFTPGAITPGSVADAETLGGPEAAFVPTVAGPVSLADAETFGSADLSFMPQLEPDTLTDAETLGEPDLPLMITGTPDSLTDSETLDDLYLGFQAFEAGGDSLTDAETLGAPILVFYPSDVDPAGILDVAVVGTPSSDFMSHYTGAYSTGVYGVGPYSGIAFIPAGIVDSDVVGRPDLVDYTAVPPDTIIVAGIVDEETLGEPAGPLPDPTNYLYGMGTYNEGPYYGAGVTPPTGDTVPNLNYGYGTYNYGPYYGALVPDPWEPAQPWFPAPPKVQPPLHILGIGPWSASINWRGAPNYGLRSGPRPARPAMALPPATGKGFTLRLNDGAEARCELSFPRHSAIIIDEMDTDLWWRRKDYRTGILEMIGRFNTAHVNLSTTDTGISCSVQFVDYQTVLGERMVLKYLNPRALPNPESMWNIGTPVMQIIRWALPTNTGLDLTEVNGPAPYDLTEITSPFHLPPDTTMNDLMDNLNAISAKHWEWWVETPLDIHLPPKLKFKIGERGTDKGVVLFDVGSGPTPIAEWTRNAASDEYANALYYTGGTPSTGVAAGGGVVEVFDAQILQYGQRDALYGNSSVDGGDVNMLRRRANKKLEALADRRASYTVRLAQGFWRGRHHIDIADTVGLRLRMGLDILHEKFRVSELTVDIDDNGLEEVSLTLGRLSTSPDPRSKRSPIARVVRYLKNYVAPNGAADFTPTPDD